MSNTFKITCPSCKKEFDAGNAFNLHFEKAKLASEKDIKNAKFETDKYKSQLENNKKEIEKVKADAGKKAEEEAAKKYKSQLENNKKEIEKAKADAGKKAEEEAAKKYKTPVGIGYCLRYKPFLTEVKDFLDNGIIGKIIDVRIAAGSYLPDWRPKTDYLQSVSASSHLGGGALLELSHEIDYANFIFKQLYFKSAIVQNSKILKIDVEDSAEINFTLPAGGECKVNLDFLQKPSIRHAYFFGSKGKILWDLQNNNVDISASDLKKILKIECWDSNKMYIEMIKDFVFNFIDHQSSKICKVSEALSVLEYIEQAKQFKDIDTNE